MKRTTTKGLIVSALSIGLLSGCAFSPNNMHCLSDAAMRLYKSPDRCVSQQRYKALMEAESKARLERDLKDYERVQALRRQLAMMATDIRIELDQKHAQELKELEDENQRLLQEILYQLKSPTVVTYDDIQTGQSRTLRIDYTGNRITVTEE